MKTLSSVIIVGIGLLLCFGRPARAQFGDMGEAVKKGAGEGVKQEMKGAAEKAGLVAPEATPTAPGAATAGASAPADTPAAAPAAADTPAAAPAAADTPAAAPGADTDAPNAPAGD